MRKLDEFIEIYFRVIDLDNKHAGSDERDRAQALLIQRENALGLESEQLDELLGLIDEYRTNENAYADVLAYYEKCRQ